MFNQFDSFFKEHEIISQLSVLGTLWKNRVVERRSQTLINIMRSIISFSSLPISF